MAHLHHVRGAHAVDVGDGDSEERVAPGLDCLGAGVEVSCPVGRHPELRSGSSSLAYVTSSAWALTV